MDASILVVGSQQFLGIFLDQIRTITFGTVEASSNLDDVLSVVQAKQPAILIVQATQPGSLELCHQIKEQLHLGWIYCIFVNDKSETPCDGIVSDLRREWAVRADALEGGADAYLELTSASTGDPVTALAEYRLLKAQLQAGFRSVQFYQKLQQTNDLLSTMALADPLTELSNRRAMEWELPRQIQNARTHSSTVSVIMLDVDYFKAVNDNHGHQVGDRVLQLLAGRLKNNLRLQDTLFRYGGEEFLILLNQTNAWEAQVVAQRLRRIICDHLFRVDGKLALEVTISLGLASLNGSDDSKGESLVRRSDYNLRLAKSSGRNQVFCDGNKI
ncbi:MULTISPECIES: GGDEF domain-containing protein [unclassified Coleofasciculus]|uniref:GGDEF domain-containing protein n=1 Tax=unclassified Coleofasciculus TaxID=2692782 RepID=UPI00187EF30C|nr:MULTISPECIES: diguanylate cyclase [unclassified Coleofasciculus]MBE9125205.1 diguanylate cyclase [Coleofasciculus sp. LEGE 07081]MBE9148782.1 diguanylate cyclase [Coleofasciculus sp. LEGE 07092]